MATVVRAVIDEKLKKKAASVLKECGLSMSEAIRLLMVRVVNEGSLPFELYRPNKETLEALDELNKGEAACFDSIEELMEDLNA